MESKAQLHNHPMIRTLFLLYSAAILPINFVFAAVFCLII